jgi:periplasmic copper chaperone A
MRRLLFALPLVLCQSVLATAHEIKAGDLVIVHSMVAEAEKGQPSAQGSVKIRNAGKMPDQLLSISAEFAGKAIISAPVPVPVPANGRAVSVPLTFENIKRKLSENEAYDGELVFEKAGTIKIDLMVHTHAHSN